MWVRGELGHFIFVKIYIYILMSDSGKLTSADHGFGLKESFYRCALYKITNLRSGSGLH